VATPRCSECRGRIIGARAAVRYEGPVPRLVRGLKDGGRPALAELLAELVVEWTPAPPLEATLVPVPLSPAREAARGFNQSALLARALSARWRRPWARALDRVGPERSQRGAGAAARTEHVRGAFLARARDELPCSVCLVDDVHTTGATLAAAAHALWLAGVRSVTARCFARALRRR
jgi:ComF family protein